MCQAYDGEARAAVSGENALTLRGFAAAFVGKPNPYSQCSGYEVDAWTHGWRCFHEGLLPSAVKQAYARAGHSLPSEIDVHFKETKELPCDLSDFLRAQA